MLDLLDRQKQLTWNQRKIVLAAILGDALEFFDYFLIGYVMAFIVRPWKLTFGEGAVVLLSSGIARCSSRPCSTSRWRPARWH
jgi:MFS transporter, putative metabolite:H+ symporter